MRTIIFKKMRWALTLLMGLALFSAASAINTFKVADAQAPPSDGIVCTTSPDATFTLTSKSGYIGTADDNVIFMWGYSEGTAPFQHPGPVLCVNEGDTVTVILHNTLAEDISITFPGFEDVLADGEPAQPQFDTGGNLTSLTNVAPANGGSMTYSFVADRPGTFLYKSGTDPLKQVRMGLFGALIVRPDLGANYANNRLDSEFNPDTEFMVLLSEIDPFLNQAVERGDPFDMNNYKPRYWMLNGRGFPDTIAPNFAAWLPSQPYGALPHIHPFNDTVAPTDPAYNPLMSLTRYLNVSGEDLPMHPHSKSSLIIARDGYPLETAAGGDFSLEHFSLPVAPGQTWDGLFSWYDPEQWDPVTNPVPVTIPNLQNLAYGQLFNGSPYLGGQGTLPVGHTSLTQCGEYYQISHIHALQKITSWGAPASGPITFVRIDPPLPNNCP